MKESITNNFTWHDGQCPCEKQNEFREKLIGQVFEVGGGCMLHNKEKLIMFERRRRMLNGRYLQRVVLEHWCKDRHCCSGPEESLDKTLRLADVDLGLKMWISHRWSVTEDYAGWI